MNETLSVALGEEYTLLLTDQGYDGSKFESVRLCLSEMEY